MAGQAAGRQSAENLEDHVAQSVDDLVSFHQEHYQGASRLQRTIDRVTDSLGRPAFVVVLVLGAAGWIAFAIEAGGGSVEQPSFAWLELSATLAALLIAVLILATQRREDQLAERRAKLTLELAILTDKKSAKIIQLLEELRHDAPDVADRVDAESDAMAAPTDPGRVLAAIDAEADKPDQAGRTP